MLFRSIAVNAENYLYFGGTAYLGLQTNSDFQEIVIRNIRKWGTSHGSSPLANIALAAFESCELYMAAFTHAQAAAVVSSGMIAGKIVIDLLAKNNSAFFHFDGNHEAIQYPDSQPFWVNGQLHENLLDANVENIVLLSDGVLTGKVHPFDEQLIDRISATKKITLVLDESHTLGILSKDGCGLYGTMTHPRIDRKISIASLGKAMGVSGGAIVSDQLFVDQVKQNEIYGSSAPMNPAFAAAIVDGAAIRSTQFNRLQQNLRYFCEILKRSNKIVFDPNYPLVYPSIDNIYQNLLSKKIVITNFQYPNSSEILNRIVITANHTKDDLQKLANILNQQSQHDVY